MMKFTDGRCTLEFKAWSKCVDVSIVEDDGFGQSFTMEREHRDELAWALLKEMGSGVKAEPDKVDDHTWKEGHWFGDVFVSDTVDRKLLLALDEDCVICIEDARMLILCLALAIKAKEDREVSGE